MVDKKEEELNMGLVICYVVFNFNLQDNLIFNQFFY